MFYEFNSIIATKYNLPSGQYYLLIYHCQVLFTTVKFPAPRAQGVQSVIFQNNLSVHILYSAFFLYKLLHHISITFAINYRKKYPSIQNSPNRNSSFKSGIFLKIALAKMNFLGLITCPPEYFGSNLQKMDYAHPPEFMFQGR
jgi:hypothetical protein